MCASVITSCSSNTTCKPYLTCLQMCPST
jgi:hypothetical protein